MSEKRTDIVWMMYDEPGMFVDALQKWEQHLAKVQSWPDTVRNKQTAINEAKDTIRYLKWRKRNGLD